MLNKYELLLDNVITKTFRHYSIPLEVTDNIWTIFKPKLWSTLQVGGPRKATQLDLWRMGEQSTWNITIINETKVKVQLLRKRWITEDKLQNEIIKWRKLQREVDVLSKKEKQAKEIVGMKSRNSTPQCRHPKNHGLRVLAN